MKKSGEFVERRVGEKLVLIPMRPGEEGLWVYELSETAVFLWNQLDQCKNEEDLANALTENFEVSDEESRAGVREFVQDLTQVGAIQ